MKIQIHLSTSLGIDCMGCSHDFEDTCEVELDEKDFATLTSLLDEDGTVTEEDLEEADKALYDRIDSCVQRRFHDLMVIDGWENHGWEACTEDMYGLMKADKESGEFVPDVEEYEDEDEASEAELEQWRENEDSKMAGMDTAELAAYLEDHYGLATDTDWMHCGWFYAQEN